MSKSKKNKVKTPSKQVTKMNLPELNSNVIKGTTSTGFKFEVLQERLANYELVEAIAEVDENPLVLPKLVKKLLGPQAEDLKEHVRDENGLVPLNRLMAEIEEIFNSKTSLKN
ncbi:hypothetical protein ACVRYQ_09410 [Streptococcus intermedius]